MPTKSLLSRFRIRGPFGGRRTLRGLVDAIVLVPAGNELRIELKGNLAAMLTAAQQTKRSPETGDLLVPVQLVAGGGFEPPTFGL
jgi:hypothetical protein